MVMNSLGFIFASCISGLRLKKLVTPKCKQMQTKKDKTKASLFNPATMKGVSQQNKLSDNYHNTPGKHHSQPLPMPVRAKQKSYMSIVAKLRQVTLNEVSQKAGWGSWTSIPNQQGKGTPPPHHWDNKRGLEEASWIDKSFIIAQQQRGHQHPFPMASVETMQEALTRHFSSGNYQ